ncbi:zinc finger protein 670-like [Hetaerina americana]|uniref:zinc finger protein 670-like n=1 Tax=Hetaerina americana TaxID=62018 RepID=UPI003A7F559D
MRVVNRASSLLGERFIPSINNVQITVKRETSDYEDQETVEMTARHKNVYHIMDNHEEDSLQEIIVKTEEMDAEEQETNEILASQGDGDQNVKNLTIVDMDKIAIEQQETVPAWHRDMDNNVENPEVNSEELCVLPSLQKDSENHDVDLVNGKRRNLMVLRSSMKAINHSVQKSSIEEEDICSANTNVNLMDDDNCDEVEIQDDLEDLELHLSSDEEEENKKECDDDTLKELGGVTSEQLTTRVEDALQRLKAQDNYKKEDGAGKDTGGILLHACQICYKEFAQRDLLKDHVLHVHVRKETQFNCEFCSEAFERKNGLGRHINSVHVMKGKYQHEFYTKNFLFLSKKKIHKSSHTAERPFKCAICLKGFVQKKYVMRHILTHTKERQHKCKICSRAFTQNSDLKRHLLTHTDEKSHKCEICSKAFAQNSFLKVHLLTHTGEKPYQCAICSKGFAQNSILKIHLLTHTGEKKHMCKICSKAFAQNSNLKRHLLTHTGDKSQKCNICLRAFARKDGLKNHIMTHTGNKPHRCNVCSKAFIQKKYLKSHMKSHTTK